jgi:Ubiquitin-like autophagy protein Apg12
MGGCGGCAVKVQFRAVGGAPQLKKTKFLLPSSESWLTVRSTRPYLSPPPSPPSPHLSVPPVLQILGFLGKNLKLDPSDRVFAYLRASFAPSPLDHIGSLWRHYRVGDELIIQYATTPAYG